MGRKRKREDDDEQIVEPRRYSLHTTSEFASVQWSEDQKKAIQLVKQGGNVFITGPGGVGKSALTSYLIAYLEESGKVVRVTASTGSAACNIGGITLHSFVGCKDGSGSLSSMKLILDSNQNLTQQYVETDVLIIDEISMVVPEFFDKVDQLFRHARQKNCPFGGIQVILVGDFLQLPPVNKEREKRRKLNQKEGTISKLQNQVKDISQLFFTKDKNTGKIQPMEESILVRKQSKIDYNELDFIFELPVWKELKIQSIHLTTPFRQKDKEFVEFLNRMRMGELIAKDYDFLQSKVGIELPPSHGVEPVILYSLRNDVKEMNEQYLESIPHPPVEYKGTVHWTFFEPEDEHNPHWIKRFKQIAYQLTNHGSAPSQLTLKLGAQVVLTCNRNFEKKLVNGARGVVVGFNEENLPLVQFQNGETHLISKHQWKIEEPRRGIITYTQIPLTLAKVITIHRCIIGNSLIASEKGLIRIESLFVDKKEMDNGYSSIYLSVQGSKEFVTATECYKSKKTKVFQIMTQMGFMLLGSSIHRLIKVENDKEEWTFIKDFKQGDSVQLRGNTQCFSEKPSLIKVANRIFVVEEKLCFLIGKCWGCYDSPFEKSFLNLGHYTIANEMVKFFNYLTQSTFYNVQHSHSKCGVVNQNSSLLNPQDWKALYAFGKDWEKRSIPDCILMNTFSNQWKFICGLMPVFMELLVYFSEHPDEIVPFLTFHFQSEILVKELQILFLNMGIICKTEMCTDNIHFSIHIPVSHSIQLALQHKFIPPTKHTFKIQEKSSLFIDQVVSQKETEWEQQMYDLHVPLNHTYIANGFVNHNSQAMTFTNGIINLGSGIFGEGQAYVALSRFKDGNFALVDLDLTKIQANEKAVHFYKNLSKL